MEFYKKAKDLMYMEAVEFFGGVSDAEIKSAMQTLKVEFPESYKAFLADFGGGDAGGEFIFGITDEEEESAVKATQEERGAGLPDRFVIIAFWNDVLHCLDTDRMENGECPVVTVTEDYKISETVADSFGEFLYDYLNEGDE